LTAKPDLDFTYYIEMDGNVCPSLLNQITKSSGCVVSLFYLDQYKPVILSPAVSSLNPITVSFFNNATQVVSIGLGTWSVSIGGLQCFILDCAYAIEFNVVSVSTPNVQIITAADKALVAQVVYSVSQTLATTVAAMQNVISAVNDANQHIDQIRSALNDLNFNVSELYPYENFTQLREDLDTLISLLPTNPGATTARNCDGPWNGASCWFQDSAGVIISVAIMLAGVVTIYCFCTRTGLSKKLFGKGGISPIKGKGAHKHVPEYRAD